MKNTKEANNIILFQLLGKAFNFHRLCCSEKKTGECQREAETLVRNASSSVWSVHLNLSLCTLRNQVKALFSLVNCSRGRSIYKPLTMLLFIFLLLRLIKSLKRGFKLSVRDYLPVDAEFLMWNATLVKCR